MSDIRFVKISSTIFSGFICEIDFSKMKNIKEIEGYCLRELYQELEDHNFEKLIETLEPLNFHIHQSFEDIKKASPDEFIYMCECKRIK